MRAFFEKRGLGAEIERRVAAARDQWRSEAGDRGHEAAAPYRQQGRGQRGPQKSRFDDGAGWIERLAREIGYDRVERGFYFLIGGVILAGCVAIVTAGFRGQEPAEAIEGVTQVQLAPQATAVAPQDTQALRQTAEPPVAPPAAGIAAAPQESAASPPPAAASDNLAAQEAPPPVTPPAPQNESVSAESSAPQMAAREAPPEETAAAPNAALEEASPPEAEPEAAPPAARDAAKDEKGAAAERASKCFVKVSGRVLTSGTCKISRSGAAVTFLTSGQSVTIAPSRGREWSLSVGGRRIGAVYKSGGCWGSRSHTWICEKGA